MVEARAYAPGVRETIRWRMLPGAGGLPKTFQGFLYGYFGALRGAWGGAGKSPGRARAFFQCFLGHYRGLAWPKRSLSNARLDIYVFFVALVA